MPKCVMEIEFYRPGREFLSGETVQGWVRLQVDRVVVCRQLTLTAFWNTRGRGNPVRKNYFHTTLFQGRWKAEDTYEYPFEFVAPDGPLSYNGENLQLEHLVQAQADIPWPGGATCIETFCLRPGRRTCPSPDSSPAENTAGTGGRLLISLLALLLLGGVGLAPVSAGWSLWGLVPIGFLLAWMCIRKVSASRLGEVTLSIPRDYGSPGEQLPFEISIDPNRKIRVQRVSVSLEGTEVVVAKREADDRRVFRRSRYRHELHRKTEVLALSTLLLPGVTHHFRGTLEIPVSAPCSIDLPENEVVWRASFQIAIARAGSWNERRVIRVVPPSHPPTPNPAYVPVSAAALEHVLRLLHQSSNDPEALDVIVGKQSGRVFQIHVTIDRITAANPVLGDPEYRNGRQIFGRMRNLPSEVVAIQLPEHYNGRIDKTRPGEPWSGHVTLLRWNPPGQSEFVAI